ncbi:MAG: ABC transporter permease [Imperialibacter sp.]|uniref:ABC transporter permease n=1 Tax=Imperialibacter sp. TaxID=2038411 RepID=UPI0032EAAA30
MNPSPPKYPLRFLRWFCREDYLDEIEGDLIELFEKRLEGSTALAKRRFVWDVVKSFRPRNIKSLRIGQNSNYTAMLKHTIILSFRSFRKYKTTFLINLAGLTSGLTCVLLIYLWVNHELSVDKFYKDADRLYQVFENREQSYGIWTAETNSGPMAADMQADFPEVEYVTGVASRGKATLTVGEKNIKSDYIYAGKDFFKVFSVTLLEGQADHVLADKSSIVISSDMAERLFGDASNVAGKTIRFEHEQDFVVSGVFETAPPTSSFQHDIIISIDLIKDQYERVWNYNNTFVKTYLLLKPGTDADEFNKKLEGYIAGKVKGETNRTAFVALYPDYYLHGKYENGQMVGGRITYVKLFSIIAGFILLIACINFTNLSTARASRRMKEVGIKKAMGSGRTVLIYQYLGESILVAIISLMLALLAAYLFLPQFNVVTGKQLAIDFDLKMIAGALLIAVVTGFLAGSYPAFYLSGFNPSTVLKGQLQRSIGELWARRGLVIFQFAITIVLITSVLVVYNQMDMLQSKDLGYNKDQVLIFPREGKLESISATTTFLAEVKNIPGVINGSSTDHDMTGHNSGTSGIYWAGKDPNDRSEFENLSVNYDLMETLGIELREGRSFDRSFGADSSKIIFNETAIRYIGLENPLGKTIKLWGEDRQIIGVVKDFHFESLHSEIKPVFFILTGEQGESFMVKIAAGREKEVVGKLAELHTSFNPGFPFEPRFLDQDYQGQYQAEKRVSTLSGYFASLAIIISCMGLFGLAAFAAERRLKEIGIRRILGSSIGQIVYMLSASFSKMILVAIAIAIPFSYYIASSWLEGFAYRIDLEWWYFGVAGVIALAIAWVIVGWQTFKVASVNPTKCLRDE